jgi:hypothetical protein
MLKDVSSYSYKISRYHKSSVCFVQLRCVENFNILIWWCLIGIIPTYKQPLKKLALRVQEKKSSKCGLPPMGNMGMKGIEQFLKTHWCGLPSTELGRAHASLSQCKGQGARGLLSWLGRAQFGVHVPKPGVLRPKAVRRGHPSSTPP